MSAPAIIESERVRVSLARRGQGLLGAERRAELVVGGSFVAAAALLSLHAHTRPSPAMMCVVALCLAIASRVPFDVGAGFTVPVQAVFVPALFVVPAASIPALVALALALGMLPSIVRDGVPASRLLTAPGNAWFAFGPALVLSLAHHVRPDRDLPLLVAALAAQFVCDFVASAVRERLRHGVGLGDLLDEVYRVYLIDLALTPIGLGLAIASRAHSWSLLLALPLFALLSVFSRERRARLEQLGELNDAYRGTAMVLGDVVEADDNYTGEHCRGVLALALEVALRVGLDPQRRRNVEFAALLHDVGKIAVPKEIINKPGSLDEHEWAIIKTHTIEGQRMLDRVGGLMRDVGQIVRSSHERWDGTGYPDQLAGEQIPFEARIVSACDALNAMTTNRSYRRAMTLAEAAEQLIANAGTQFDPAVVEVLLELIAEDSKALSARQVEVAPRPDVRAAMGNQPRSGACAAAGS
jgi:putative nucleotidyltransferase with HDIG domain